MIKIDTERMYKTEFDKTGESENTTWFFQELSSHGVEFQTKNGNEYPYLFELITEEDKRFEVDEMEYLLDVLQYGGGLYLSEKEWNRSETLIEGTEEHYGMELFITKID